MNPERRPQACSASGVTLADAEALMDRLPSYIILLDESGTVVATNRAWRDYASTRGADPAAFGPGASYREVCDLAASDPQAADRFGDGLRAVLQGAKSTFELESEGLVEGEPHRFRDRVTRVDSERGAFLVLSHVDLSVAERPLA